MLSNFKMFMHNAQGVPYDSFIAHLSGRLEYNEAERSPADDPHFSKFKDNTWGLS